MAVKNKLDDMQIRRWISAGIPVAKSDGDGLTFTLSKAGTASWILRYRIPGKRRELTIGNYPDISLASARAGSGCHGCSYTRGGLTVFPTVFLLLLFFSVSSHALTVDLCLPAHSPYIPITSTIQPVKSS